MSRGQTAEIGTSSVINRHSERLTDCEAAQASSDCPPSRGEVTAPGYRFHWVLQIELAFAAALSGVFLVSTLGGAALFLILAFKISSPLPADGDFWPLLLEEVFGIDCIKSLPEQCRCWMHVGQMGVFAGLAGMPVPAV